MTTSARPKHGVPLIGITCMRTTGGAWAPNSPAHFMDFVFHEYNQAVLSTGGAPMMIPVAHNERTIEAVADRLDGLLITGGVDIHPRLYGAQAQAGLGEVDEGLDQMELAVTQAALERDLPILAICRGIQLLNVSRGGTLYQDLPADIPDVLQHRQKANRATCTHTVEIAPASCLGRIVGEGEIWVNSQHHQAVRDVADGFAVSARARDGVIEAMEDPAKRFVVGVQWHPEGTCATDSPSKALFAAFVQAAAGEL